MSLHELEDELIEFVDDLLLEGKFDVVDKLLKIWNPKNKHEQLSVDLAMVTIPAKNKLNNRCCLIKKMEESLELPEEAMKYLR